jgi:hypothetical protein
MSHAWLPFERYSRGGFYQDRYFAQFPDWFRDHFWGSRRVFVLPPLPDVLLPHVVPGVLVFVALPLAVFQ